MLPHLLQGHAALGGCRLQALQLLLGGHDLPLESFILLPGDLAPLELLLNLGLGIFQGLQLAAGTLHRLGQKPLPLFQQVGVGGVQLQQPLHIL